MFDLIETVNVMSNWDQIDVPRDSSITIRRDAETKHVTIIVGENPIRSSLAEDVLKTIVRYYINPYESYDKDVTVLVIKKDNFKVTENVLLKIGFKFIKEFDEDVDKITSYRKWLEYKYSFEK